jgi:hydrogenase nickel incorporation protein HypA/HybF
VHETSLAKRILDEVVARSGGSRVTRIRGVIAEDEALSREALGFHFAAHARATVAEGAELELELRHVTARCGACGHGFLPEHHVRLCPRCGSPQTWLEGETGVRIDSIDVSEP